MNNGREKGSRKKPVKSRRPGYKGSKRKKHMERKQRKLAAEVEKAEASKDLDLYLFNRFGIKKKSD